jgi:transcriptional regulator with XRE-family HTH domain
MTTLQAFAKRIAQERRLKAARDERDISNKDIAEAVGTSDANVSKWIAGLSMPRDDAMKDLARYFGVRVAWLRYGEQPRIDAGAPLIPLTKPQRVVLPRAKGKGSA